MEIESVFHLSQEAKRAIYYLTVKIIFNRTTQSSWTIYFSLTDLYLFIFNDSVKTLTIVTNMGQLKYISKKKNYSKTNCIEYLRDYNKNKDIRKFNRKDIEIILKELYNNGNIIYKVR